MNFIRARALLVSVALLPLDLAAAALLLLTEAARAPWRRRRSEVWDAPRRDSVVIQVLNWDGKHLLEECLPRLREAIAAAGGGHRVLVVDNGSQDGSVAYVREQFPEIQVLELDRNFGFSTGNNRGMAAIDAGADIVVILNNDMLVDARFLKPLLDPFADPSVFAVSSQIFMADSAARREETGKTRARFENGLFYMWHDAIGVEDEARGPTPVFWAGGGSSAVDRRKFAALGGFDPLYHPFYVEDVDLSYRAWKQGWKSLIAPASRVTHRHRASTRRFGAGFIASVVRRNHFLFVWRNVTNVTMLIDHFVQLPRSHARAVMQGGAALEIRAYLGAWLRLPLALARRLTDPAGLDDPVVARQAQ